MNGPNRMRSTTAPETSAAVITQKLPWKVKKSNWGIALALERTRSRRR